jgi:glycosyltransferase involved in cell wall biosynthesis
LRIAILHPYLFRLTRGIERFVVNISAALTKQGMQVDVLTWRWPEEVVWAEMHPDVKVIKMPYFRYFAGVLASIFYLFRLAARRYDFVVVFFAAYGEARALQILRILRPQRYCIVFHFPEEQVPHQYREFLRRSFAHRADVLIAVSEHTAAGVRRLFGRECYVVHNGTDPETFVASPGRRISGRRKLGIPEDSPALITLAALEERKGIQWVIRALPLLATEFPGIRYFILGEGPFRSQLETLAADLGVSRQVCLLGSSDRVVETLSSADVACLLSTGEASPVALFEYMSMGLPTVTSRRDPFPEMVSPDWAIMVDEEDSAVVARTIARLLRDAALRARMGEAGRRSVVLHHTWPIVASQYAEILAAHAR